MKGYFSVLFSTHYQWTPIWEGYVPKTETFSLTFFIIPAFQYFYYESFFVTEGEQFDPATTLYVLKRTDLSFKRPLKKSWKPLTNNDKQNMIPCL